MCLKHDDALLARPSRLQNKNVIAAPLTKTIGRKRVAVPLAPENNQHADYDDAVSLGCTSTRNLRHKSSFAEAYSSTSTEDGGKTLADLPFELLKLLFFHFPFTAPVSVVCRLDHSDLKIVSCVSKSFREVALFAKKYHFDYKTPKKSRRYKSSVLGSTSKPASLASSEEDTNFQSPSAPNAPKKLQLNVEDVKGLLMTPFPCDGKNDSPTDDDCRLFSRISLSRVLF